MTTNNNTASASSGGIGFFGLLTIVLVILKATGYLNISWFLCFLPMIIGFSLAILILLVVLIIFLVADK